LGCLFGLCDGVYICVVLVVVSGYFEIGGCDCVGWVVVGVDV